jgi:hypothetical protein
VPAAAQQGAPDRALVEEWLETDLRLMTQPEGWRALRGSSGCTLHRRPSPDDPNDLFLWRCPTMNAPAEIVFEALVHRILDYHQHWTREFVGGSLVEAIDRDTKIFHQRFDPGIPGFKKRDLCYVMVARRLDERTLQASYRSVDAVAPLPGHERIRWWGANLCIAGERPGTSELVYLDREDQGGAIPAWLMNLLMPRYLRYQCDQLRRFFADGGPPALRPTAT